MIVGYARVSTAGQCLDVQLDELNAKGCERIFSDKATGTNMDRSGLAQMMTFVRDGDTIVVSRLDRFARSLKDLFTLLDQLTVKGVAFQCLHQPIDTASSTGKLTLAVLGAVAEFENDLRRERQREGIAKAKAAGVYKRGPVIDAAEVLRRKDSGENPSVIARAMGISRMSVYRTLSASVG
ncbi:recombinase family protein [Sphingobium sp. KCTC 72723]|uniref:recombinase family protein n=1 Tax=Sphingobium sp. KCTC 72723 TaxID=2733867 RepID=UPI00165E6104|nr:recombinase family protein [Sphingobium sp. KCTC 72723]